MYITHENESIRIDQKTLKWKQMEFIEVRIIQI